jgi:hypothetical protein
MTEQRQSVETDCSFCFLFRSVENPTKKDEEYYRLHLKAIHGMIP